MRLTIDPKLIAASKGKLALGVVISRVTVEPKNELLWRNMSTLGEQLAQGYDKATDIEQVSALRDTYTAQGLSLSKYVGSNEALWKRLKNNQALYQINTVVDVNNYVSLESLRSVGSYNLNNLEGSEIVFRPGAATEEYPSTKKRSLALKNLPVLADAQGPFGSPTSDSDRALIQLDTVNVMTVIFSFDGQEDLERQLDCTQSYLRKYANAEYTHSFIVSGTEPKFFDLPTENLKKSDTVEDIKFSSLNIPDSIMFNNSRNVDGNSTVTAENNSEEIKKEKCTV